MFKIQNLFKLRETRKEPIAPIKLQPAVFKCSSEIDDWKFISRSGKVTNDCMRDYKSLLDWDLLSSHQQFSITQLVEFKDVINFGLQNQHFSLPLGFIEKYNIIIKRPRETVRFTPNRLTLEDKQLGEHNGNNTNRYTQNRT